MGYAVEKVVQRLIKQDGTRLGDSTKLLQDITNNSSSYASSFTADRTIYTGRVASVLLIGFDSDSINDDNNRWRPQLISVKPSRFMEIASQTGRVDNISNGAKYFGQPGIAFENSWYPSPSAMIPAINMTFAEILSMNASITSTTSQILYGCDTNMSGQNSFGKYWTSNEEITSGYADTVKRQLYEQVNIPFHTYLYYTIDIIDYLKAQYGYVVPDASNPLSQYNWVRATLNGKQISNTNYYKVLYLPETEVLKRLTVVDQLKSIDPAFTWIGQTNIPSSIDIGATMMKYSNYTLEQLYVLFNYAKTAAQKVWWQQRYATAKSVSPFKDPLPFTKGVNARIYNDPSISSKPSVLIMFNTNAGILKLSGEMDFPYTSNVTSYPFTSALWDGIVVSATVINGSWSGPSYKGLSMADARASISSGDLAMIDMLYDAVQINITGLPQAANAIVFFKSLNVDKLIKFIRYNQQNPITVDSTICGITPDVCFSEVLNYVSSNPFDSTSNKWCDIASSATTRATNFDYYSDANAKTLKDACTISYSKATCNQPDKRYKSSFTNRSVRPCSQLTREKFTHIGETREKYSGSSTCPDACSTATNGTLLYDACNEGSVAYCKNNGAITSDVCRADATKYPAIAEMLNSWCKTNLSDSNYSTYCITHEQQAAVAQQAPVAQPAAQQAPVAQPAAQQAPVAYQQVVATQPTVAAYQPAAVVRQGNTQINSNKITIAFTANAQGKLENNPVVSNNNQAITIDIGHGIRGDTAASITTPSQLSNLIEIIVPANIVKIIGPFTGIPNKTVYWKLDYTMPLEANIGNVNNTSKSKKSSLTAGEIIGIIVSIVVALILSYFGIRGFVKWYKGRQTTISNSHSFMSDTIDDTPKSHQIEPEIFSIPVNNDTSYDAPVEADHLVQQSERDEDDEAAHQREVHDTYEHFEKDNEYIPRANSESALNDDDPSTPHSEF